MEKQNNNSDKMSLYKRFFDGILSLNKFGVNFLGGSAMALYFGVFYPLTYSEKLGLEDLNFWGLSISFIFGYIWTNFVVLEARKITLRAFYSFLIPLMCILLLALYLLGYPIFGL